MQDWEIYEKFKYWIDVVCDSTNTWLEWIQDGWILRLLKNYAANRMLHHPNTNEQTMLLGLLQIRSTINCIHKTWVHFSKLYEFRINRTCVFFLSIVLCIVLTLLTVIVLSCLMIFIWLYEFISSTVLSIPIMSRSNPLVSNLKLKW